MKQIIMTLALAISSMIAFAGNDTVNKNVLNSFNQNFSTAQDVKWTVGSDYYMASFVLNDQYISAFYANEGYLICVTRNISLINLPMKLQESVHKGYSDYWVTELFEFSNNEGTSYYITVEKADTKIVLKSDDNTNWSVFKKTAKS
jgi:hypothetical protein